MAEDRIDDSDEDEFHEERSGRHRPACSTRSFDARGYYGGYSADDMTVQDTWSIQTHNANHSSSQQHQSRHRFANASAARTAFQQPDLLKDIMTIGLFKNSADRLLRRQQSDENRGAIGAVPSSMRVQKKALTKHNSLDDAAIGSDKGKKHNANRRSISRSLTSSDIIEMQKHLSELPKDKPGKRSKLMNSCIAQ